MGSLFLPSRLLISLAAPGIRTRSGRLSQSSSGPSHCSVRRCDGSGPPLPAPDRTCLLLLEAGAACHGAHTAGRKGHIHPAERACCSVPRAASGLVRRPRVGWWLLFLLLLRDSTGPALAQVPPEASTAPWVWPGRAGTSRLTLPDTVKIVGEEAPRRAGGLRCCSQTFK